MIKKLLDILVLFPFILMGVYYLYIAVKKFKKEPFLIRAINELLWLYIFSIMNYLVVSENINYYILAFMILIIIVVFMLNFKEYNVTIYNVKSLSNVKCILEETLGSRNIKYIITNDSDAEISDYKVTINNYRKVLDFKELIKELKKKVSNIDDEKVQPKFWRYTIKAVVFNIVSLVFICLFFIYSL